MTDIKIAVACHKPSELPHNPLYVPVQVGSAIAPRRMEGIAHDDEGENISAKNGSYCELTAQYWAWKNLDADYLGLCHYRRFLTFSDGDFEFTKRNQVEAGFLDSFNMDRFGLEDASEMSSVIEQYDCVVGLLEDVSGLSTPKGKQKTVYKHWAAHDRDLINVNDLDQMIKIVDEFYPEYSDDLHLYLEDKWFLGYNCFVMKKDLFNKMCHFEFDVLSRLEALVDLSHYNQMRSRIFGFMAEILYSVFIFHIEKNGAHVKHVPLVYFNVTEPLDSLRLKPVENAIPIVFNAVERDFDASIIDVTLRSFIKANSGSAVLYDLIVLGRELSAFVKAEIYRSCEAADNFSVRFIDLDQIDYGLFDRVGYVKAKLNDVKFRQSIDPEILLPWLLPDYHRVISFEWHTLFYGLTSELWQRFRSSEKPIVAAESVIDRARINEPLDRLYKRCRHELGIQDPYGYFDTSVMVLDLDQLRNEADFESIKNLYLKHNYQLRASEAFNVIYEGRCESLDLSWAYPVDADYWRKGLAPAAPLSLFRKFKEVANPSIVQYDPLVFSNPEPSSVTTDFWRIAREGSFYEVLLSNMVSYRIHKDAEQKSGLRKAIAEKLPVGSDKRQVAANIAGSALSILYPSGSKRRERIEQTWTEDEYKSRLLKHLK